SVNSVCQVVATGGVNDPPTVIARIKSDDFNHKLVRVGDTIRFNFQGHTFRITGPDSGDEFHTLVDQPGHTTDPDYSWVTCELISSSRMAINQVFPWASLSDNGTPEDSSDDTWTGASVPVPYQ